MKIVFLQDDFPPISFGGAGISTFELAKGIKEQGHDVSVITTVRSDKDAEETEYEGLKVYKIKSNYPGRWRSYISLYNRQTIHKVEAILRKIKPDVVHANNIHEHLSYHTLKVAKNHSKKVIWTARDAMSFAFAGKVGTLRYLEDNNPKITWLDNLRYARKRWNPFRNIIIRHYLSYVDQKCAVSNALKDALEVNGIKSIKMVHTGLDIPRATNVIEFSKKYSLENKKIILFGGRLGEGKGGRKAIEALQSVVREVPDVTLVIVGKVDWFAELMKKEAARLGVEDHLIFTGWIGEEIGVAYDASNLVWVPSIYLDPLPRVALEAMAHGKPVVGACFGGTSELIEDGISGYIVNPLNVEEIALKTTILLKDKEKSRAFGQAAQQRIKSVYNLDQMVANYLQIYLN